MLQETAELHTYMYPSLERGKPEIYDNICYTQKTFTLMLQNTWVKHGFSCINIRQVAWEVLKTEARGRGFQHLPSDLANVNALKNHVRSLLLHKN